MSWQERANNKLTIITGDGFTWDFTWKDPSMEIEYNVTLFEFPEVEGTFADRRERRGIRIPLTLFFIGDDHIDKWASFRVSADDKRHWVMKHPYYGVMNVQPIRMGVDQSGENVSKIQIEIIETIVEDNPKVTRKPQDEISFRASQMQQLRAASFATAVPSPNIRTVNLLRDQTAKNYQVGKKALKTTIDAEKYFELYNESINKILNITADPLAGIRSIQNLINSPFQFANTVKARVSLLAQQYGLLQTTIETLAGTQQKASYDAMSSEMIASMAQALVYTQNDSLNSEDYQNATDVVDMIELLRSNYDSYVGDIDSIQSATGTEENGYVPDPTNQRDLQDLVDYTSSVLMGIALNGRQERSIILEYDSNPITLAHRFYGLQEDDSTIDYLIKTNGWGISENEIIKKGRRVIYYV